MFGQPPMTEQVYNVTENEDEKMLKSNFPLFYEALVQARYIPDAKMEMIYGIKRALSGISNHYQNALLGVPQTEKEWDRCIEEQLQFFKAKKVPFVWYVDDEASPEFKQKLISHGFKNEGTFRGVMGELDQPIPFSNLPEGYTLERVVDETGLREFVALICQTFSIPDREAYFKAMKRAAETDPPQMYHWVARKKGKVVSALSTMIHGNLVSFWNGATLSDERRHGLSSALRQMALRDAISRGCTYGASYLMAEGMAFGICSKLGFETRWCFNAFTSPPLF
ncbi:MAG: GNAT family N-acetyltransferase [Parachlamydiales bacterium]|nr:GNAT family N-acetyltransferase [Parachlamydiales bacterium]